MITGCFVVCGFTLNCPSTTNFMLPSIYSMKRLLCQRDAIFSWCLSWSERVYWENKRSERRRKGSPSKRGTVRRFLEWTHRKGLFRHYAIMEEEEGDNAENEMTMLMWHNRNRRRVTEIDWDKKFVMYWPYQITYYCCCSIPHKQREIKVNQWDN